MLIVGLGNPGEEYKNTFHNLGFMVVDRLAERLGKKVDRAECGALTKAFKSGGEQIVLAKPTTYMNLSGQAVKSLMVKYKQEEGQTVIIYDDMDLPRFSVRARESGSGGTHNGMKNIVDVVASQQIKRIRIGFGRGEGDARDYVLSRINAFDKPKFDEVIDGIVLALCQLIKDGDFEKLMRDINTTK